MSFFVEDVIESAKLRTLAPISQNTFQLADIIRIASEELSLSLVADVTKKREDFFLATERVPLVKGLSRYGIPSKAIGNALKVVYFETPSGQKKKLERADVDRLQEYGTATGEPSRFYFEGDEIVLLPANDNTAGALLFSYPRRPSALVSSNECARITGIATAGIYTTLTVANDLSTTIVPGQKVDFVSARSPFLLWADGVTVTNITTNTIQVVTRDIQNEAGQIEPSVGDSICPEGKSNVVQLPEEFHAVLSQMVAVRILAALGHIDKWNAAKAVLEQMRSEASALINNRVESSPERVKVRLGHVHYFRGR